MEQDPSCLAFVDALRQLKSVYKISHLKEVDPNHREIVKKLEISVMKLHNQFKVPITPKLHIVFEHLPEYFEMTGKTLRKKTDQTVQWKLLTPNWTNSFELPNKRCGICKSRKIVV